MTDTLARRRVLCRSQMIGAPNVMLIDVPRAARGQDLLLTRYHCALLETDDEVHEFESFLADRRSSLVAPTLFDRRPSSVTAENILISQHEPAAPGWPWLIVCCWPPGWSQEIEIARGRYSVEAFATADDCATNAARLIDTLTRGRAATVRLLSTGQISGGGNA